MCCPSSLASWGGVAADPTPCQASSQPGPTQAYSSWWGEVRDVIINFLSSVFLLDGLGHVPSSEGGCGNITGG